MLYLACNIIEEVINWLFSINWVGIIEPILTLVLTIIGIAIIITVLTSGTGKFVKLVFGGTFKVIKIVCKSIFRLLKIVIVFALGLIPRFFKWSRKTLKNLGLTSILSNVLSLIFTVLFVIVLI